MDEQELIRQVQEGDEMAFSKILKLYKDKIVNYVWQLTGDYQKAVEISQETFIRVYFKAKKYKPIAPLSSWIYSIASNLTKTEMRRSRRFFTVSIDDINHLSYNDSSVEEKASHNEMIRELRCALNSLHPRYRIPVVLKDIEGFSQEEIAEILNKPIGTIKARISRGRISLKNALKRSSAHIKFQMEKESYENGRA